MAAATAVAASAPAPHAVLTLQNLEEHERQYEEPSQSVISDMSYLPRKEGDEDHKSEPSSVVGVGGVVGVTQRHHQRHHHHTDECIENNEQVFVDTPRMGNMGHDLHTPSHVLAPWPPANVVLPGPEPDLEGGHHHHEYDHDYEYQRPSPPLPAYDDPTDLAARPSWLTGNSTIKPAGEDGGGIDRRTQCYRVAGILVFLLAVAMIIILIATSTGRFTGRR